MDKSITLPPDEIFRNLENAKRFAIDIGTDTKLCLLLFCTWLILWNNYQASLATETHDFKVKVKLLKFMSNLTLFDSIPFTREIKIQLDYRIIVT